LLDRLDIHVVLPPVNVGALQDGRRGETSAEVRARVERARGRQRARMVADETTVSVNASLSTRDAERVAGLCAAGTSLITRALERLSLSARAYAKLLRVARTIADLEGEGAIRPAHVAEAISYRVLDRASATLSVSAA
jgi:magnesium chelatase family protein